MCCENLAYKMRPDCANMTFSVNLDPRWWRTIHEDRLKCIRQSLIA